MSDKTEKSSPKARTVLYVEDNKASLLLMETLLARIPGVTMVAAENGKDGIALAESHLPDAIILDINLPDMNGFDILGYLKVETSTENIPVIALTARTSPTDMNRGMKAGFFAYLTKPINIQEVTDTLERSWQESSDKE
ncbi:MAG: response regulator [Alphaproteobacteria bacterium]|nr:response regulator [Alphaproteobacteria bacterium]